ncbi:MAG: cation-translocating P-type ATPase [Bdellovibrionales bacterium]
MHVDLFSTSLTDTQAQKLLVQSGANELPQSKKENFWIRSSELLKEPMLLLLIATAAIYLAIGDLGEGVMLAASVFVVIGISLYQERKSENALAALRELSSPRALVIRSGKERRIAATQLVPGDLIVLHEGDRVPADACLLESSNLNVDESLLTGESFPAKKSKEDNVYSSTLVVGGTAYARVTKTGANTEVGKIGKSLQEAEPEELNLTKEIRQIVRLFAWTGALVCVAIVLLYGLSHGTWVQAFLIGLATEMALMPEEFPVVLTIFLAMGAWRLSKIQVLIRRPGSIERLGAVTVLCVDKTGTLTENQMTVAGLNNSRTTIDIDSSSALNLAEDFHQVVEFGVLASHLDPFDPMEKAIRRLVESGNWGKDHIHRNWDLVRDYPLSAELMAMSCVWKDPAADSYIIASKGAPEAVIDLCHLSPMNAQQILDATKQMAGRGLRVLGVARGSFSEKPLPKNQHDFSFQWVGLIGLEDPLRAEVPAAVQLCRNAGIRIIMMTGDYPETALKIAGQAGIDTLNALLTGSELNSLSDAEVSDRLRSAHIFARMVPEQKLRIVKLLRAMGHVVAMTGDGVNDAPSLKWADVGISMGARGTDVAREASDIVLLDDNFNSSVSGIHRGRLIFSNIKKAMSYIVSIHVPIAGLSILPVVFNWPLILMPIHIVFLELIIDPACTLMFESLAAEDGTMSSPPRSLNARLFSSKDMLRSFLQGALVLGVATAVLWYETQFNHDDSDRARTFTFIILAMGNIGLIFADMSGGSFQQLKLIFSKASNWLIVLGIILCTFLLTQIAEVRLLFHFGPLQIHEFIISLSIAFLIFMVISAWNRRSKRT